MRGKYLVALVAALLIPFLAIAPAFAQVQVPLAPRKIPQFAQPLPLLGPTGIPFTLGTVNAVGNQAVDIKICEFQTTILPLGTPVTPTRAVPVGQAPRTWVWGYQEGTGPCNPAPGHSYLGPVVLAKRGTPTEMSFTNKLPDALFSHVRAYTDSTDQTVIWGDPLSLNTAPPPINLLGTLNPVTALPYDSELNLCYHESHKVPLAMPPACLDNYGFSALQGDYIAPIPTAVHLHGGEVPAVLDGGPDSWWTPDGKYGHGYYSKGGVLDAAAGKAVYVYPNAQEAEAIWFHDHILGATRLNVYAGLAGGYMITDDQFSSPATLPAGLLPLGLDRNGNSTLDLGTDETLVPLIIQDRMFDTTGQLYFPAVGINPEHPYWIPEFVGDTIAVNGAVWPFMDVQPKRYRFLVLNGSNARVYELGFAKTVNKNRPPAPPAIWVIANDQGYLDGAVPINPAAVAPANKLVIMPGERYEIIVDFAAHPGATLELTNSAATPYPFGVPVNPKFDGKIMQFRVAAAAAGLVTSYNPALGVPLRPTNPIVRLTNPAAGTVAAGVIINKVRRLTLNEVMALGGPVEILVNNTPYDGNTAAGRTDFTPVTTLWNSSQYSELPHEGETELWEIVNLTVDAHPMHPHLVAFQILNRQAFDALAYPAAYDASFPGGVYLPGFGPPLDYNCNLGAPGRGVIPTASCVYGGNPDPLLAGLVGPMVPPSPQETGWKDTFMVLPGMVNRALVRFSKITNPVATPADDPAAGYDFSPAEGHGYVWHCHIIDHEDNEMMRPYQVIANPSVTRTFQQGIDY